MTFFMPGEALTKKQPTMDATMDTRAEQPADTAPHCTGAASDQQRAQHHGGDQRDGVGFEQVGGHAGAVADVVTHVVGDHGRVARVVFRNTGLDLAHQISADVSAFGENAATQPREDRDQR